MGPFRAWIWLVALSLVAAASALVPVHVLWVHVALAFVVLGVALAKARLVLGAYLGLENVPQWRRGFDLGLALFGVAALGLWALAL